MGKQQQCVRYSKEGGTSKSRKGNGGRPSVDSERPIAGSSSATDARKSKNWGVYVKRGPQRSGLQTTERRRESTIVQTGKEDEKQEGATSTMTDCTVSEVVRRKKERKPTGPVTCNRAVHTVLFVKSEEEKEGETEREPKRRRSSGNYGGFVEERRKGKAAEECLERNEEQGSTLASKEHLSETPQDEVHQFTGGIGERKKGPVRFQAAVRRGSGEGRGGKENTKQSAVVCGNGGRPRRVPARRTTQGSSSRLNRDNAMKSVEYGYADEAIRRESIQCTKVGGGGKGDRIWEKERYEEEEDKDGIEPLKEFGHKRTEHGEAKFMGRNQLLTKPGELKGELRRARDDKTSLQLSLNLTNREMKRLEDELTRKEMLLPSLRESIPGRTGKLSGEDIKSGRKRYEIEVDIRFIGVASRVHERILVYAKQETSELCLGRRVSERNWSNRAEEVGTGRKHSLLIIDEKEMVPLNPMELALGRNSWGPKAYTPSFQGGSDEMLLHVVRMELEKPIWRRLEAMGIKVDCEEELRRDLCLRRRMKKALSDTVGVRKRNARDRLFFGLGYTLLARKPRKEDDEEVAVVYEEQMKEAEEKLLPKDERGDPILCAWRLSGLDRICFSGYDETSKKYGEEPDDLYFKNGLSVEVLGEFMGYDAERPCRERETSYVDGSVMHLARLDAWIASVVEALKEVVGRGGKRQMLFSKLYAEYLPLAVEDILLTARRKIEGKYGKELVNCGVKAEDPTEVVGNEERERTVACWMPSNQMVYLCVQYEVFLDE